MRNKIINEIAISGVFIAVIAIMTFVPYVGFIQTGSISITLIHIVVLIAAMLFGWKQGLITGIAFGLCSLIKASTLPGTADFIFVNPLISVLPRAIFGVGAGFLFDLFKKRINNIALRASLFVVSSILLTALHTIMVLTMLFIFQNTMNFSDGFMAIIKVLFAVNCALEMGLAGVVVPVVAFAVSKAKPSLSVYSTNEVNNYEKD